MYAALEERLGASHVRRRLSREEDPKNQKITFGYWQMKMKYSDAIIDVIKFALKATGTWKWGLRNCLQYQVNEHRVALRHLPDGFQDFRILHLSDLHVESIPDKGEHLIDTVRSLHADLCVITGDFRYHHEGDLAQVEPLLRRLCSAIRCSEGILAVLGNHDSLFMVPILEKMGIRFLINESMRLNRNGSEIWVGGVDDPHFFRLHDLDKTWKDQTNSDFKVLLAHSPDLATVSESHGVGFYLCGHGHGGQICLPGQVPVMANMKCPRAVFRGPWKLGRVRGYTSRGVGTSGIPVRYFSPPEIVIHQLVKES